MRSSKLFGAAAAAVVLFASFSALAKEELVSPNPWRDTEIDYEHGFNAVSLSKSAQPTYNPYYAHRLYFVPYWHVGDFFAVKGRFILEQELTNADDTTQKHEVVASDLYVDTSFTGVTEPYTGIKFRGGIRWLFPTSKASQMQTMQIGIGPGVGLERTFPLLEGLTIGYAGRMLFYVNKYTTANNQSSWINVCGNDASSIVCGPSWQNGSMNPWGRFAHGPEIKLGITPKLDFDITWTFLNDYLYAPAPQNPGDPPISGGTPGGAKREMYSQWVLATLSYSVLDYLGVSLGFSTKYGDLAPNGKTQTPVFNIHTEIFLSINFLLDPLVLKFQ